MRAKLFSGAGERRSVTEPVLCALPRLHKGAAPSCCGRCDPLRLRTVSSYSDGDHACNCGSCLRTSTTQFWTDQKKTGEYDPRSGFAPESLRERRLRPVSHAMATFAHTHARGYTAHTRTLVLIHTRAHTYTHIHTRTCNACAHTHLTRIPRTEHTHAHTHTRTHTHTHTHTPPDGMVMTNTKSDAKLVHTRGLSFLPGTA